eukprot:TRINITY_DN3393_c0_g1_i1.p1 TRINITY_DN3393_c0_g1~~TRINITY_DN3393_c0_g1_i1.p1  ORF type:complete len:103 (-),score=13.05 TRINITY_DN3393_c0_g1_i1:140-448(-)
MNNLGTVKISFQFNEIQTRESRLNRRSENLLSFRDKSFGRPEIFEVTIPRDINQSSFARNECFDTICKSGRRFTGCDCLRFQVSNITDNAPRSQKSKQMPWK